MMTRTIKDRDYITSLGQSRCPFCVQPSRFQQQEHLFIAFVQLIADFILKLEAHNFFFSFESEAFQRCIAQIKGPQNYRNWKCIMKIVASFRGGTKKYLEEYQESKKLCMM